VEVAVQAASNKTSIVVTVCSKCTIYKLSLRLRGSVAKLVSVLDSGAVRPGFKSQPRCCRVTVLGKFFTPIVPLFAKQWKLVAALLRVAMVTVRLAESNGSLLPGLWLTSPTGWLRRTGISSGTLCLVIEYGLYYISTMISSTVISSVFHNFFNL